MNKQKNSNQFKIGFLEKANALQDYYNSQRECFGDMWFFENISNHSPGISQETRGQGGFLLNPPKPCLIKFREVKQ